MIYNPRCVKGLSFLISGSFSSEHLALGSAALYFQLDEEERSAAKMAGPCIVNSASRN